MTNRSCRHALIGLVLGLLAVACLPNASHAQLFGERTLSRPLSIRPKPGAGVGAVSGSERYIRGNRRPTDFIGSDSRDPRAFVGAQQGTTAGQVRAATEDLRRPQVNTAQLNPPLPPRGPRQMYPPKLELGFTVTAPPSDTIQTKVDRHLRSAEGRFPGVQVSVTAGLAKLTGTAGSVEDRRLAEALVQLEPGIEAVQNDLVVAPAPAPESASPSVPRRYSQ